MDELKYSGRKNFEWAVKLNRAGLNLIGLWPNPEENPREKLMSNLRVFLTFFMVINILLPSIHSLIKIHSNITLIIDNLQWTLPILTTIIRLLIFRWKKKALASIMNMIMDDWIKSKTIHERNTMIKWALRARIIITCTYIVIAIVLLIFFGMPVFGKSMRLESNSTDSGRSLPLTIYYTYDVAKTPQYEFTFISQFISGIFTGMLYTGIDNFLGLLVFHICGQMDIMRNRLKHSHENFRAVLKSSVIRHIRLLRAIDIIEDTYNMIVLILFLYFGIIFALCGFLLIILFEDKENGISFSRMLFLFVYVMSLLVHMSIYCVVGEALVTEYNGIHYALYDYEWYSLDPKEARYLIPFMIKVNIPVYFTAGKIFPVTLATLCNLIKTSVGYVSVLLTTRKS